MNNEQIIEALKAIKSKKQQIEIENQNRHQQEMAICQQFKVDECNNLRDALAVSHASKVAALNEEIESLTRSISEAI